MQKTRAWNTAVTVCGWHLIGLIGERNLYEAGGVTGNPLDIIHWSWRLEKADVIISIIVMKAFSWRLKPSRPQPQSRLENRPHSRYCMRNVQHCAMTESDVSVRYCWRYYSVISDIQWPVPHHWRYLKWLSLAVLAYWSLFNIEEVIQYEVTAGDIRPEGWPPGLISVLIISMPDDILCKSLLIFDILHW